MRWTVELQEKLRENGRELGRSTAERPADRALGENGEFNRRNEWLFQERLKNEGIALLDERLNRLVQETGRALFLFPPADLRVEMRHGTQNRRGKNHGDREQR